VAYDEMRVCGGGWVGKISKPRIGRHRARLILLAKGKKKASEKKGHRKTSLLSISELNSGGGDVVKGGKDNASTRLEKKCRRIGISRGICLKECGGEKGGKGKQHCSKSPLDDYEENLPGGEWGD